MMRRWIGVLGTLAALTAAGCASDWKDRYELESRANKDLADQMEEVRNTAAADSARAEAIAAQSKALERENAQLLEERKRLDEIARKWQEEAEAAQRGGAAPAPATAGTGMSPAERIARDSGLPTRKDENGNVEITLSSDVNFPSGSEVLSDSGRKSLKALASTLNGEYGTCKILVEGHTDNEPLRVTKAKYGDNLGLSTARANAVTRFMQDEMRIDAGRIVSAGRGESEPIADNKSAAGRAKNRRVEIVVVMGVQSK